MKSMLLYASAESLQIDCGPAHYALDMSLALDARVRAPVFELDVITPASNRRSTANEATGSTGDSLAAQKASLLQGAALHRDARVTVETERSMSFGVSDWLCDLAKLHDITISGVDQEGLLTERQLAEALLFRSGRPILVVPRSHQRGFRCNRILVAWDYSAPAARAVADALPLLGRAEDVLLLTVGDDKSFGTNLVRDDVVQALGHRGIQARAEERRREGGKIGDVLQAIALQEEADLLVMGAFGHSRLAEFILGGATRDVLDNLKLPVLMSH